MANAKPVKMSGDDAPKKPVAAKGSKKNPIVVESWNETKDPKTGKLMVGSFKLKGTDTVFTNY